MFITEQHIAQKPAGKSRNRYFSPGMPLATRRDVKQKFTYKEFTLVLGIFVAMIIAITLWFNVGGDHTTGTTFIQSSERIIPAIHSLVKAVAVIQY